METATGTTTTGALTDKNQKAAVDPALPPSAELDPTSTTAPSAVSEDAQKGGEDQKKTAPALGSAAANDDSTESEIQKKIRRAERFGVQVQLSEEEKRNSRAERFGTGVASNEKEAPKGLEDQKRKARAERFGLAAPVTDADEEAKKKSRLSRFAPHTKTDPQEEEKRKARAMRFANPPSSSLSQGNDKGNIEPKAAIAGNAGGGS